MPHVSGHMGQRPKIRPKNVPDIIPRPKTRPAKVPRSPIMGNRDPEERIGVKGPKGGGEAAKARVEVGSDIFNKYNNDGRYGYYNDQGYYVPADIDMRDGGGADKSDTFFEGGGFLSLLGNIAKVRPYGQKDTPREQIGFRNINDMFDRGGPQHSGGAYRGGGTISMLGNLAERIGGVDQGTRTRYNYDTTANVIATPDATLGASALPSVATRTLDGTPVNTAATIEVANKAIKEGVDPLYAPSQSFTVTNRAAAIEALRRQARNPKSWDRFMAESPSEAEELIREAMQMQNPLYPANP